MEMGPHSLSEGSLYDGKYRSFFSLSVVRYCGYDSAFGRPGCVRANGFGGGVIL